MAGNFFHTAVDGMVKTQQQDTFGIGQQALDYFNSFITDPSNPTGWAKGANGQAGEYGYWVDDYGWWGLAFLRAYLNADALGYDSALKNNFAVNANNCWEALHACWNDTEVTWTDPNNNQHTITGGIPNTWEDSLMLAGRNSVTNECYWLLSMFLAATFTAESGQYLNPSTNSNNFFAQGTQQNILFDSNGLVLERFFGMRSASQSRVWPNTDHPNWTWLGDQGLFFSCCWNNPSVGLGSFNPDQARAIIDAVQKDQSHITAGGVLHEDLAPYEQFQLDYACGKGTLIRYLTMANDAQHHTWGSGPWDGFLQTNAVAVWKNQLPGGLFPYYWGKEAPEPPSDWGGYGPVPANAVLHAAGLCAIMAPMTWLWNQPID